MLIPFIALPIILAISDHDISKFGNKFYWSLLIAASAILILIGAMQQIGKPMMNGPLSLMATFFCAPLFFTLSLLRLDFFRTKTALASFLLPVIYFGSWVVLVNLGMCFWLRL